MSEYTFKLPDLGEGTVESEIAEWYIKVGDLVKEEDVVGTMMTDKAAVELASPVTGTVVRLAGEPGDVINVGAPLVIFNIDASDAAAVESEPANEEPPPPASMPPETGSTAPLVAEEASSEAVSNTHPDDSVRVLTSPAIRRRAREANIDLAAVPGSGNNGRILRKDLDAYLQQRLPERAGDAELAESGTSEIRIIGLRRMIAERMTRAKREIPHFSYVEEIDITALDALRQSLNEERGAEPKLTLLPFLALALVQALKDYPQCNTTHDSERDVLIRHESVHLGLATQTPDGLKVPVVRHAEQRGLEGIAAEMRRLADAARSNKIKRHELSGSSITLTSLGKLGGIVSTPVINQPEVAIVGVNRAVERPVVINGQVEIRLMMNLSSSFDHRFVDGFDAASMIQQMKQRLEQPAKLFIRD